MARDNNLLSFAAVGIVDVVSKLTQYHIIIRIPRYRTEATETQYLSASNLLRYEPLPRSEVSTQLRPKYN